VEHAPIATFFHSFAGVSQCVNLLASYLDPSERVRGDQYVYGALGILQMFSDYMYSTDPTTATDVGAMHLRNLHAYVYELVAQNKVDTELFSGLKPPSMIKEDGIMTKIGMYYWLCAHYFLFTIIFLWRFASHSPARYFALTTITGAAVLSGQYQYLTEARKLPPNPFNEELQALGNHTLRVAVTEVNTSLALVQQEANYALMLVAAYSHMTTFPFRLDAWTNASMRNVSHMLPRNAYRENWKKAHANPSHYLLSPIAGRGIMRPIHLFRNASDLSDECLSRIKGHLSNDSEVFSTLFSKLKTDVQNQGKWTLMELFLNAVTPSIKAYFHYARNQPYRKPTEVVYAFALHDYKETNIERTAWISAIESFDTMLTVLLKNRLYGDAHGERAKAMFMRNHLVNYEITTDSTKGGCFYVRHGVPESRNFVPANISLQTTASGDELFSRAQERESFFELEPSSLFRQRVPTYRPPLGQSLFSIHNKRLPPPQQTPAQLSTLSSQVFLNRSHYSRVDQDPIIFFESHADMNSTQNEDVVERQQADKALEVCLKPMDDEGKKLRTSLIQLATVVTVGFLAPASKVVPWTIMVGAPVAVAFTALIGSAVAYMIRSDIAQAINGCWHEHAPEWEARRLDEEKSSFKERFSDFRYEPFS
jgi:hypothetical protein